MKLLSIQPNFIKQKTQQNQQVTTHSRFNLQQDTVSFGSQDKNLNGLENYFNSDEYKSRIKEDCGKEIENYFNSYENISRIKAIIEKHKPQNLKIQKLEALIKEKCKEYDDYCEKVEDYYNSDEYQTRIDRGIELYGETFAEAVMHIRNSKDMEKEDIQDEITSLRYQLEDEISKKDRKNPRKQEDECEDEDDFFD